MQPRFRSCDVFCRVIDNFGDAAVSWRLACQLARESLMEVRLWIDQPEVLHALAPEVATGRLPGHISIRHWVDVTAPASEARAQPPDLVIEAFGCGLDDDYVAQIAGSGAIWIVLEYLSAEAWVASRHGLPSPHPRHAVRRYFFFPGFTPGTGGLLRERGLGETRRAFREGRSGDLWWQRWGGAPGAGTLAVSLFGYQNAGLPRLLDHWADSGASVLALIPDSKLRVSAGKWVDSRHLVPQLDAGLCRYRTGHLEIRYLPFLSQDEYDHLLWACDCNFVRGEDSFVRAQWAARPLIWQIYPQDGAAHLVKLNAFIDLYGQDLQAPAAEALRRLWQSWNSPVSDRLGHLWDDWRSHMEILENHALDWDAGLRAQDSLAVRLMQFWRDKVQ